ALVFLSYIFFGDSTWLPDDIRYPGASLSRTMSHMWLGPEGVFGIALGVSTKFVFLFVLFGALLEKGGAGNYFIQVAFSLLGHLRGGPAKAAVVASGMTGLISGSSIANVVTTGTFTIPLMRRVGFSAEKAGAVEVASSVNGQIMPPVMGAAAFLMVEYVGIPYTDVIRHAFIPAIISYIALVYIVHLEAVKSGMQGLPKPGERLGAKWAMIGFGLTAASLFILAGLLYWVLEAAALLDDHLWVVVGVLAVFALEILCWSALKAKLPQEGRKRLISGGALVLGNVVIGGFGLFHGMELLKLLTGDYLGWVVFILLMIIEAVLIAYAAQFPELHLDDPNSEIVHLPEVGPTVKSGLHFLLPIVVLVWCLMVERLSPALSAFWATALMIGILLNQRILFAHFRKHADRPLAAFFRLPANPLADGCLRQGFQDLFDGLVVGARNMIGIGIATATAGIVVGTVTLTGIGLVLAGFVEDLSGGSVIIMLFLVAILSLILGMGLPTTANYIVVSSLMAPVIVQVGAANGLLVPLIAVHLFVFYFGIMADVTPPVGLASFAAAAVSGGDPMKTGVTAFYYSLRTAALPFLFIFNTDLILVGVQSIPHIVLVFVSSTVAMLIFAAATQGYFFARSRIYESAALLLVAFTIFRPGAWMDMAFPPTTSAPGSEILERAEALPADSHIRLVLEGEDFDTLETVRQTVLFPLGEGATGEERLAASGLHLREEGDSYAVDMVDFGSPAQDLGIDWDFVVVDVLVDNDVPPAQLVWIPAFVVLGLIIVVQRRRARHEASAGPSLAKA
ncbi:MAG: TRAP transporter permease, partial [Rhodospirillaceae bacterium]|nr:TRAP transporter permease [Rhodospirillaceae bacterium]